MLNLKKNIKQFIEALNALELECHRGHIINIAYINFFKLRSRKSIVNCTLVG